MSETRCGCCGLDAGQLTDKRCQVTRDPYFDATGLTAAELEKRTKTLRLHCLFREHHGGRHSFDQE